MRSAAVIALAAAVPAPPVYRADATNADASNIIPATGGNSYATTTRAPLWSQNAIPAGTVIRMAVPLWAFSPSGTIVELDLPQSYDFACALEYPFVQATSGLALANRYQAAIVGGATVFHYTVGGQTVSELQFLVTAPVAIPAMTPYGGWLTHEAVAGRAGVVANAQIQMATNMANGIQRYGGALQTAARAASVTQVSNSGTNVLITATTTIAVGSPVALTGTTAYNGTYTVANNSGTVLTCTSTASGRATESGLTSATVDPGHIATNAVMTATQITAYSATAGSTAFLQIGRVDLPFAGSGSIESWLGNGNSKQAGNFEGVPSFSTADGVTTHGDRSGDKYGNRGLARLATAQGMGVAQMSKGSDRDGARLMTPTYTGTISGTAMTVSAMALGCVWPGQQVIGASAGTFVKAATVFTATCSTGNATLTVSQMTLTDTPLAVGQMIFYGGVYVGTISALGTGTGGTGTYTLSANAATSVGGGLMTSNVFTLSASQTISSATTFTAQRNYARRLSWMANANPHRVIGMCPTNELGTGAFPYGTPPALAYQAAGTAVALDQVRYNGANFYIAGSLSDTASGVTAGVAPTGTTPGVGYPDGGVTWYWIGSTLSGAAAVANSQDCLGAGWVGQRRARERLDHAALPNAKFYGVTQTPLTNAYTESITAASGNYSYVSSTGVLSFTTTNPVRYTSGAQVTITGLSPAAMDGTFVCSVSGSVVSVTLATGLAAPTGTAVLSNAWTDTAGQTIQTAYASTAAAGTSMRSWINRFLRNQALAQAVLGYLGVIDTAAYLENGNPTTPAAETAVWGVLTDAGGHPDPATAEGGHESSFGYETIVSKAMADTTLQQRLAA